MSPESQAIFAAWSPPLGLSIGTVLVAGIYLRGWFAIRRTRPYYFTGWRLASFLTGLFTLWFAVASPIDGFADALLSAHMVQHLLLMSVVPPLVLLGAPVVPLLRGLPRWILRPLLAPLIRLRALRKLAHFLVRPVVAWLAMNLVFLGWHLPAAYDFALEHERWHDFEHICFLVASLLFWWVVLTPWPGRRLKHEWILLPYLLSADIVNTALSAFLAFCGRSLYPYYANSGNAFHVSPLQDQILGAAIMWVIGSIVFVVPFIAIAFNLLSSDHQRGGGMVAPRQSIPLG